MSFRTPSEIMLPIRHAAERVFLHLGSGRECGEYLDALEAEFAGGAYGMERNVLLPRVSFAGRAKQAGDIRAHFTFVHRQVAVQVLVSKEPISDNDARKQWYALTDTGLPLALLLNFGGESFEYRRVLQKANLEKWRNLRTQLAAEAAARQRAKSA
jgi:hypothetical protein